MALSRSGVQLSLPPPERKNVKTKQIERIWCRWCNEITEQMWLNDRAHSDMTGYQITTRRCMKCKKEFDYEPADR